MINVWNNQWSKSFVAALVIVLLLLSDVCACIGYFSIVLCEEKIYLKCFFKGKDKTLSVFILQKCHVMCCEIYQYFVWKWIQFCQWILHHIYILLYNNLLVFDIQIQLISQWSLSVWVWLVNVWWLAVETVKVNRSLTALPLDSGATKVKHARFSPVAPVGHWPRHSGPGIWDERDFEHIPLAERLRERWEACFYSLSLDSAFFLFLFSL